MTDFCELCARVETLEAAVQKHIVETSANVLALASRIEALELAKRQSSKTLDLSDLPQWTPEQVQKLQALDALASLQRLTTDPNIIEPLRRALEEVND